MIKTIFVAGGAGYIGSHVVKELIKRGYKVIVYDSLEKGHKASVKVGCVFIQGNLSEKNKLDHVFKKYKVDAVMHFANFIEVGESVKNPKKYFDNNVTNGKKLLEAMEKNSVKYIIFSSSAAIYGDPKIIPIPENARKKPKNPYGFAKLAFENILLEYERAYGIKFMSLRYFNAAGADFDGKIGEDHKPETHLVPLILQTILGKKDKIEIYGVDYDTKDGSCIRDYIHVDDIAKAHILALTALESGKASNVYNLGNGRGYSVREVIKIAEEVTGRKVVFVESARREGDPTKLVADYSKIKKELGWEPEYDLRDIIKSAWEWHSKHPEGYEG